jgi:very-short-patch-repair endonuclease
LQPEVIEQRRLICGDAYAFQGDERNVIFLSMVAAPGELRIGPLANDSARQRFNVAASRAQDQLWLFHTATLDMLSPTCMRHQLLKYMLAPTRAPTEPNTQIFDSQFERDVYQLITARGFHVRTQVSVGDTTTHSYRIDLVVEGMQGHLAVECDGDRWHGPERHEKDMARQRDLERAGWQFFRVRGGDFYRDPTKALEQLWVQLDRLGIRSGAIDETLSEPPNPETDDATSAVDDGDFEAKVKPSATAALPIASVPITEPADVSRVQSLFPRRELRQRGVDPVDEAAPPPADRPAPANVLQQTRPNQVDQASAVPGAYRSFEGAAGPDPRTAARIVIAEGLCRIIEVEGPVLANRAYDIYLRGCNIKRMGHEIRHTMNVALQDAIRRGRVVSENESGQTGLLCSIVRLAGSPPVRVRARGPRDFNEIPPSEVQFVGRLLARDLGLESGSDAHLRAILDRFDLVRLTTPVGTSLLDALARPFRYIDDLFDASKA